MVSKSKLKMALAAEKGVDFQKLHQKKARKEAAKKNPSQVKGKGKGKANGGADDEWESADEHEEQAGASASEDDESEDEEAQRISIPMDDESDSDSEIEMEAKIERKPKSILKAKNAAKSAAKKAAAEEEEDEDEEEEEDEEDIPMSDLEDLPEEDKEDLIPHTRLTINNTTALTAALNRIALPTDKSVPFVTHQCVTSSEKTADEIEDVQDDLKRELAFYKQSLEAAKKGRALLKAEGVPFSRPNDFFAEMLKDDGHMEKVKAKLVEDASAKKASAEARKQRDLKKFGKQVQVAKLQERHKEKRDTLEKIKSLKRKRQESGDAAGTNEADLFDVGVDSELKQQKSFGRGREGRDGGAGAKRQKKNEKYGFGGKKKHAKSGDAMSSADMSSFSARRMKTGDKGKPMKTARLGKARRNAGAQKR